MGDRTCGVEGCTGQLPRKGGRHCQKHARNKRLYGDPLASARPLGTPAERFWAYVDRSQGECWQWAGPQHANGYGFLGVERKHALAHVFAYQLLIGPIPAGLHIDHLCRNRGCVNPAHLEPVTPAENTRRGYSPWAVNSRKTHCIHDHEFTDENTYVNPRGERQCRACRRSQARAAYLRKNAASAGE